MPAVRELLLYSVLLLVSIAALLSLITKSAIFVLLALQPAARREAEAEQPDAFGDAVRALTRPERP